LHLLGGRSFNLYLSFVTVTFAERDGGKTQYKNIAAARDLYLGLSRVTVANVPLKLCKHLKEIITILAKLCT
jgi:hypothetical protein